MQRSLHHLDAKLIYPNYFEPEDPKRMLLFWKSKTGFVSVLDNAKTFNELINEYKTKVPLSKHLKILLTFGELEFLPSFFLSKFLSLDHSRVSGQQTFRFKRQSVFRIDLAHYP